MLSVLFLRVNASHSSLPVAVIATRSARLLRTLPLVSDKNIRSGRELKNYLKAS